MLYDKLGISLDEADFDESFDVCASVANISLVPQKKNNTLLVT